MGNKINLINLNKPITQNTISNISKASVKDTKSLTNINNKLSDLPKQTNLKETTTQPKSLSQKIQSALSHGAEYLKDVRNKAEADKKEGVKPLEGANRLWGQLLTQVDTIGQMAQDKVIDNLASETGKLIESNIKDTKIGNYLEGLFGNGSSSAAASKAGATAATEVAGKAGSNSTSIVSSAGGTLSKVVGGVGAAYSLYKLFDDFGKSSPMVSGMHGATVGAYVGTMVGGPVGTVIGGAIGLVAGGIMGMFKKSKHPETIMRDQMQASMQETGFIDKNNNLTLADGSKFTIGKGKFVNLDGTERENYQIDFNNPLVEQAIGWMQPLAEVMTQGNQKLKTDLLGYMVNAATSNTNSLEEVKSNVVSIFQQSKLNPEDVIMGLGQLAEEGIIKEDNLPAYVNGLQDLISGTIQTSNPAIEETNASIAA